MLITTDVWARGIDVQQVSLVINYDLPAYVKGRSLIQCANVIGRLGTVKITFIVSVVQGDSDGKVSPST